MVLTKNIETPIGPSSENTPVVGKMIIPSVHVPTHVRGEEQGLRSEGHPDESRVQEK